MTFMPFMLGVYTMKMKLIMENFNNHLNEMKSNLPPQEQAQLQADIELVKRLKVEIEELRKERSKLRGGDSTEKADFTILGIVHKKSSPIGQIDDLLKPREVQMNDIGKKYNIGMWHGGDDLIRKMSKKFRRKSLQ